MRTESLSRILTAVGGAVLIASLAPLRVEAQSGKWVATIPQLSTAGGGADLTIEPRNDKQSRARITLRNIKRDMRLAWDIVEGSCRDEGNPIAPQPSFGVVQVQLDGSGTATATVPKLESGKRYYVRVFDHQTPATDASAYGCGNISEKP